MEKNNKIIFSVFLLAALMLLPGLAFAQGFSPFTPVPGDKSMQVLAAMFGEIGVFGASSSDAFSTVIATFNGAVLIIGGVLVAYTILAGTLGTAHDGEMLGKKFSSVWLPIRTAMGTALVLPVLPGGYCIMQGLVAWLIVQGIGLADVVWSSYMSSSNIAKTVVVSMESPQVRSMAWNTFGSLACVRGYEKVYNDTRASSPSVYPEARFGYTTETTSSGTLISFGTVGSEVSGFTNNSCGTLFLARTEPFASSTPGTGGFNYLGDLSALNGELSAADAQHLNTVNTLISSIDTAAISFVNSPGNTGPVETAVNSAALAYSNSVKSAAAGIVSQLGDFRQLEQSATQDGWMLAGAWFMRMSYLQDVTHRAIAKTPELSPPKSNISQVFKDQYDFNFLRSLNSLQDNAKGASSFGIANSIDQSSSADTGAGGLIDTIRSGFGVDKFMKSWLRSGYENFTGNDSEHPILQMKRVGEWSAMTASAMYAGYALGIAKLGALPSIGQNIAIATLPIVMIVFPTLMTVSFLLIYVLPMMPFFIWFGLFIGWVVLVVQALLAAPMWAVMHLSPHGDDLTGSGAQGYKLVLSLLLRPVLMVFGLIAALTMITVIGQMVNKIFFNTFLLSQQDSSFMVMLIGMLAAPLLYFGFMYTVITKIMSVIHIVPDQMLNWFGGGGPNLGEYSDMGHKGSSTYVALGAVGNIGGRAIEGKRQMQDMKQQVEQTQELKKGNELKKLMAAAQITQEKGAAAGSMYSYASGLHLGQNNELEGAKASAGLEQAVNSVGGAKSFEGQSLQRRVEEGVKENLGKPPSQQQSYRDILDNATAKTVNEKYGDGTAKMAAGIGGGYSTAGFTNAIGLYDKKASELKRSGASESEIRDTFAQINQQTAQQFDTSPESVANGGDRTLASFLNENMKGSRNSGEVVDERLS